MRQERKTRGEEANPGDKGGDGLPEFLRGVFNQINLLAPMTVGTLRADTCLVGAAVRGDWKIRM